MTGARPSTWPLTAPGPYRLYKLSEILKMPKPQWLIEDILPLGGLVGLYGPPGVGKSQPLDEAVLTPTGWQPMADISVGSLVIGSSGLPVQVMMIHPQGELEEWQVVFADGATVRCSADHLWLVSKGQTGHPRLLRTSDITYSGHHKEGYWHTPMLPPVSFAESGNPLPLDPYLLGALLGDGGLTHYVGFTSADEPILEQVRQRLPPGCVLSKKVNNDYAYQIITPRGQPNPVWTAIRLLGLAGCRSEAKHIPIEYLHASAAERLALLQGLMDTDGYVSDGAGRTASFSSAARALTEGVEFLVRSLGGLTRPIYAKKTKGLDAHIINFRMPVGANCFLLPRKVARCSHQTRRMLHRRILSALPTGRSVPMQCISVGAADGLYVTKDFVLTHNSFVALDMAMSIGAGLPWQGKTVKPGCVLYVSAEGGTGIGKRATAWLQTHDIPARKVNMVGLLGAIPINADSGDNDVDILLTRVMEEAQLKPKLVVVDTLARCFDGDENQQKDMGRFIAGVAKLQYELKTTVLVVHHTNVSGARERGNTAFRGAADAMISVERRNKVLKIACNKQKDAEEFSPMRMVLSPVEGTESCVVSTQETTSPTSTSVRHSELVTLLVDTLGERRSMTWSEWRTATGTAKSTFSRLVVELLENDLITEENGQYRVTEG